MEVDEMKADSGPGLYLKEQTWHKSAGEMDAANILTSTSFAPKLSSILRLSTLNNDNFTIKRAKDFRNARKHGEKHHTMPRKQMAKTHANCGYEITTRFNANTPSPQH
jgi:hypothetical protein